MKRSLKKDVEHIQVRIENVKCEACTSSVRNCLLEIPGVMRDTSVVFEEAGKPVIADVYVKDGIVSDQAIVEAIHNWNDDFKATVIGRTSASSHDFLTKKQEL